MLLLNQQKFFNIVRKILDREEIREKPIVLISVAGELDVIFKTKLCYLGCFFPRPGSEFFHSGSPIESQKDPGSRIRIRIKEKVFLTQKTVSKLSEK
jgi:hypothetical protein